jgi:S-formylglutathione hydrolase FrmB
LLNGQNRVAPALPAQAEVDDAAPVAGHPDPTTASLIPVAGEYASAAAAWVPSQRRALRQSAQRPSGRLRRRGAIAGGAAVVLAVGALVAGGNAGAFDGVPLLNPWFAVVIEISAVLALVGSWVCRQRRWYTRTLPLVLLAAAAVTGSIAAALRLTGTVTDAYPPTFALWAAMGLASLIGLPFALRGSGVARRCGAVAAVPLTLTGALLLINDEYGAWPTVGDLLGHTNILDGSTLHLPPGALKSGKGVLVALDVPATKSHFAHRQGSVYLPPAYFTPARPNLPVIVMLAGAPGGTTQWPTSGKAVATVDAYAASHGGRAPIMVFVDQNGSATGDTECVDGPRGNAETYLTVDVPAFVAKTLRLPRKADHWAVVGFSEGGTCAIDLALAHPGVYLRFVDLAGDAKPTLGNPAHTLANLFGGDTASFTAHDPARLLASHRYKGMSGWFAAGAEDHAKVAVSKQLAAAASRSGLKVHHFTGVAGHNWQFASAAFAQVLPALCTELGLH